MGLDVFELRGNSALYEALGVSKVASDSEIRRAYRKLALIYHPDKNPDGVEKFREIGFAYGILSDPQQRSLYDSERLRSRIETEARVYDPTMDPNVELTAEELREFVERKLREEEKQQEERKEFERRRREEMQRRAEYDARNPRFKEEYERMLVNAKETADRRSVALSGRFNLTTAELVELFESKQQAEGNEGGRKQDVASVKAGRNHVESTAPTSVKQRMLQEFRVEHNGEVPAPDLFFDDANYQRMKSRLPFVAETAVESYPYEVRNRLTDYANFDYRGFIESLTVDSCNVPDEAILADALRDYDRTR